MKQSKTVFVDGVDFQHELGYALGGTKVYSNLDDIKNNMLCWNGCGIVECEITFKRWAEPQDLFKGDPEMDAIPKESLAHYQRELNWFKKDQELNRKRIKQLKDKIKELENGTK
jgi:hypothetical protein